MAETEEIPSNNVGIIGMTCCVIWAALVGMSVPLGLVNTIFLNSESEVPAYHAFYINNLSVLMGGLELLPFTVNAGKAASLPTKWWHLAGGLCSLPAFGTIAAGPVVGSQLVLVVQLAALLSTFYVLDVFEGKVLFTDFAKLAAILSTYAAVVLDNLGDQDSGPLGVQAILLLVVVAISGTGFALQAKCNNALAEDLGSAARATVCSACVNLCVSIPIDLYLFFGMDLSLSLDGRYWYLWLLAGLQSAFYIGSMAYLPKLLGYTGCYVISLSAKLATGLMVDAYGWAGSTVPITVFRVLAVSLCFGGAAVFNLQGKSSGDSESTSEMMALPVDSCDEPLTEHDRAFSSKP